MPPRIGAQTVTWKDTLRERMDSVVRFLAGQGYQGVETGMRFFDPARTGEYRDLYAATGFIPSASTAEGNSGIPRRRRKR